MTKIGDAKRKLHGKLTGRPDNFSWLIEGKLAGSAIPTSKKEIEWMQEEGVKTIVEKQNFELDEAKENIKSNKEIAEVFKYFPEAEITSIKDNH